MANDRKHIRVSGFYEPEEFKSKGSVRTPKPVLRDRVVQGGTLKDQFPEPVHDFVYLPNFDMFNSTSKTG